MRKKGLFVFDEDGVKKMALTVVKRQRNCFTFDLWHHKESDTQDCQPCRLRHLYCAYLFPKCWQKLTPLTCQGILGYTAMLTPNSHHKWVHELEQGSSQLQCHKRQGHTKRARPKEEIRKVTRQGVRDEAAADVRRGSNQRVGKTAKVL